MFRLIMKCLGMTFYLYAGIKNDTNPQAGRGKGVAALLKEGEWNTLRVRARGDRFEVWLNGTNTTEDINHKLPRAPLPSASKSTPASRCLSSSRTSW